MSTTGQAGATPEQMLREFHASKAIHGGLMPGFPTTDIPEWVRDLRMALLTEEVRELYDAAMAGDIVGIADGIADVAYVVTGTAVAYGIPFDAVFAEVHRSNMTKVNTPSEAKLVKGPGYEPPDIAGVLGLGGTAGQFAAAYEPATTGAAARVFGAVATKPCGCGPDEPCGAHAEAGPPDDTTCARTAAPDGTRERTGVVPPLDRESLRGIVGNAVANWWTAPAPSKEIADALWPLLEHMQSAAAGSHEGVRLWMADCGELVAKHRERAGYWHKRWTAACERADEDGGQAVSQHVRILELEQRAEAAEARLPRRAACYWKAARATRLHGAGP